MKRLLFILFILTGICSGVSAQQYMRAVGVRGGLSSGLEYRVFSDELNSYKILVSTRHSGLQATALKEFHRNDVFDLPEQISFVYGVGLHAGCESWRERHYTNDNAWYDNRTAFVAGLDGLAALELTLNRIPLTAGVEVKPFFNVLGRRVFEVELFDFAFTLKYLF